VRGKNGCAGIGGREGNRAKEIKKASVLASISFEGEKGGLDLRKIRGGGKLK